jgi:iron complex outermembrane receptor protein
MKRWVCFYVIYAALILPATSMATDTLRKENAMTSMDEIVVTATRQEEKIYSVPVNITVIDEWDIKNSTAYDIPDLLRTQAGVFVNDIAGNRRNYTVDLRGFGETAGLNTLVLVDGRRINQADLSGTDWALIPLDRVKRIEISRGGRGSTLYGDNASGGVINIITKEGEAFRAGSEISGGSYDTFKGSAYVSGSQKEISYSLSGSYLTSDGYRNNSDTEAKDLGANFNYYLHDRIKLNLSGGFHKDSTGLPGAIKTSDFAVGTSRTDSLFPDDFADVEDYYVKGGPEVFFLNDSTFKMDLSFRKRNFLSFASFDAGSFIGDTDIETVTLSPQLIFKEKVLGLDNSLILGFDYTDVNEDITNSSIFFGVSSIGIFKLEKENFGAYIHDEIKLGNNVAISGGYRHDRAKYTFNPSTPDRKTIDKDLLTFGANYTFFKKSSVYLSYSQSFRYPVMDELFSFFTNSIVETLEPQTSDDYEFGIRYYIMDSLYAGANIFRIDTKNEIIFNPTSFANENLDGKTRRDGVEISLTKTFTRATISGNYTFTDATIEGGKFSGKNFPNVPEHKFSLKTLLSLGYGFSVSVNGVYVGERPFISDFANDFEDQEDYLVINTKLIYNWKQMTAFLNINNIFNEEYSEYGGVSTFPITETGFFPSPKINFILGLSAEF